MTPETDATIMLVDDEPENLRVLGTLLTQQGYTVRSFPGGKAALMSAPTDPPDLILLDIRMPAMDGFEVCTRLKTNTNLKDIPVLILSAADEIDLKVRAFELGCADYVTKPFQSTEVLARIDTHLAISRYRTELEMLNRDLEARIQERTEDLLNTNKDLRKEIKTRCLAQEALRASEEKYRRIVTTANEAIITTDEFFTVVFANQMALYLFDATENQIIGQPALSLVHPEDRHAFQQRFQDRETGKKDVYECRIRQLDGESCWVIVAASPVLDPNGAFKGSVGMLTDITQRKQAEIELTRAYAEIAQLKKQIEADNIYLQEEIKLEHDFDQIIGNSDEIKYVLYRLEQVAKTDSTVIILGETGTGKELFARALHNISNRADRPLIKVNCATLPEHFIESELFGHVKGAFTDARKDRQGRFELADRGSLFLDEIGEIPLALQPKLLRVLQDGEFERLGTNRTIKTDVRVIAATNRDLETLAKGGKFRQDLWYRLNVFPITIPPLRNRKADIPLLVNHFVRRLSKNIGKEITDVPESVMIELEAYDWPGNVRELEHVIERAIITSPGNHLQLTESLISIGMDAHADSLMSHAEMERDHILRVLGKSKWVIEGPHGAAKILDIHPNTLRYRMKKLAIKRPS